MNRFIITSIAAALTFSGTTGCNDPQPAATPTSQPASADADAHDHADGHDHDHEHKDAKDDHANRIALGSQSVAGLTLAATQDEPIKAGGEGAFELMITGGKPKAVRFWVGLENGQGSVKAKASEETADNWHSHVEVPEPLPAGSKFFAEVEPQAGDKFTVSFDLK